MDRSGEPTKIHRDPRFFGIREVLKSLSAQLLSEFKSSSIIGHSGDAGEERERFLQKFLSSGHFPKKYALSKGHGKVISSLGHASLQTDIVIYDAFQCPVLRDGENHQFFPIESVYGTIQVKSRLSKAELLNAAENIASVKRLAEHKSITRTSHSYAGAGLSVGDQNPLPFGAIFAYSLDGNSLDSLTKNLSEYHAKSDPKEWVNLICVLDEGVIYNSLSMQPVLDSRDLIRYHEENVRAQSQAPIGAFLPTYEPHAVHHREDALLDFYLALIGTLGMMDLLPPPLHKYVDLPISTSTGNSYKVVGMLAAWSCPTHGLYEPRIHPDWVGKLADYIRTKPQKYPPSEYLAHEMGQSAPMKLLGGDIDKYMPSAFIYSKDGVDPLTLIRMEFTEGGGPVRTYLELEINGDRIFMPQTLLDKEHPFFEKCPKCPTGTAPTM